MKIYKLSQHKAYHGTNATFEAFDIGYSGQGIDKEGPGIYFTNNIEDASHYGSNLHTVELEFNKVVPLNESAPLKEIKQMILWSLGLENEYQLHEMSEDDFYESPLSNWTEDPYSSFIESSMSIFNYGDDAHESFQSVWYEYYRDNPVDYLKNMTKLGYDGVIVPKDGVVHYIVFNPSIIKRM